MRAEIQQTACSMHFQKRRDYALIIRAEATAKLKKIFWMFFIFITTFLHIERQFGGSRALSPPLRCTNCNTYLSIFQLCKYIKIPNIPTCSTPIFSAIIYPCKTFQYALSYVIISAVPSDAFHPACGRNYFFLRFFTIIAQKAPESFTSQALGGHYSINVQVDT